MSDPVHLYFCKIHLVQEIKITLHDMGWFHTSAAGPVSSEEKSIYSEFP